MGLGRTSFKPPFCPRPECKFHLNSTGWRFKRIGFFRRQARPFRIQRFLCLHCRRSFSSQTFDLTYWLKRPDVQRPIFFGLLSCSAFRQIARAHDVAPSTIANQAARLGRHCLLLHEQLRPKHAPEEKVVVDGFESFEFSQYHPIHHNLAIGAVSHFTYAHTDSELRRKGRMTARQRRKREAIEKEFGRADPKSVVTEVAELIRLVAPEPTQIRVHSDEHPAYPRAFRSLRGYRIEHEVTPSKAARTHRNPLFPVNLFDNLIRHCGANHKRETLAWSKRRASSAWRLAVLVVWRNYMKSFSEKKKDASPAQRLGLLKRKWTARDVLDGGRIFRSRTDLPDRLEIYYRGTTQTRRIPNGRTHRLVYAD